MSYGDREDMEHIPEGVLHAYLDGQLAGAEAAGAPEGGRERQEIEVHLAECAECRGRLEEVRRVRDRADSILSASGPVEVSPPPFEEILARSRVQATRRRVFRLNRVTALGWAATIVLAVGVGWIARGSLGFREAVAPEASSVAADTVRALLSQAVDEELANEVTGTPTEDQARLRQSELAKSRIAAGVEAPVAAPAEVAAQQEPALERKFADADAREREEAQRLKEVVEADVPAPPAAAPARQRIAVAGERRGVAAGRRDSISRAREAGDSLALREQARAEAVAQQVAALGAVAAADSLAMQYIATAEATWLVVDQTTAREYLDGPIATIQGLPAVSYAVSAIQGRRAVRITQRLESGGALEVIQQEVTARPADAFRRRVEALEAAPAVALDSVASVSVKWGDYVITARAKLAPDSLRALLANIRD
ncbi:MAG: anti-sigma factor family protein [Armatimonadota bacterium]